MTYNELKAGGLCVSCWKPNSDPSHALCLLCREKRRRESRKNKEYLRSIGFCVRCGREKAEEGKSLCLNCTINQRERQKKIRNGKSREKILIRKREDYLQRHDELLRKGICTQCGKRKAPSGYVMCEICRKKKRISNRARARLNSPVPLLHRSEWPNYGICYDCGVEPTFGGYKICKKCYEKRYSLLITARKTADTSYFRQLNRGIRKVGKK